MQSLTKSATVVLALAIAQGCGGPGTTSDPAVGGQGRGPVGYANEPDDQRAGAVSSVDPNEDTGTTYLTMVDMLRGRVPGLQISESPSGEITVRIRGISSISAQAPPLLVIDGVPVPEYSFSSTLRTLDPRDVRTVQVLKDAGSTSMYGSRGAAGVILIKLKRR